MVNSNVSISWNVSISFKPILFTRYGNTNTNGITPIYGVIKLCHVKKKKGNLIEVNTLEIKHIILYNLTTLIIFCRMLSPLLFLI